MPIMFEASNASADLLRVYEDLTGLDDRGSDYYEVLERQRGAGAFAQYHLLKRDGSLIGLAEFGKHAHLNSATAAQLFLALRSGSWSLDELRLLVSSIEDRLRSQKFERLEVFVADAGLKAGLMSLGYQLKLEIVETILDLEPLKSQAAPVWPQGFEVKSFSELHATYGEEVYDKHLDFVKEVLQDIPGQQEQARNLSAHLVKASWQGSHFLGDGCLFLVHEGQPVGIHNIVSFKKCEVSAGLTGILRPLRRRGLMTRLKTHGLIWASKNGYKIYRSYNELANPMLRLNLGLGFQEIRRSFELSKSLL